MVTQHVNTREDLFTREGFGVLRRNNPDEETIFIFYFSTCQGELLNQATGRLIWGHCIIY